MPSKFVPKETEAIFKEISEAPPRAAILVAASLLEHYLTELIQADTRPALTKEEKRYVLAGGELLSDFADKIWAAYFLRLIGQTARRDMNLIREIRNECAHNMNPTDFLNEGIASRCRELRYSRRENARPLNLANDDHRGHFTASAHYLISMCAMKHLVIIDPRWKQEPQMLSFITPLMDEV